MFALGQKADIALRSHAISALPPKSDVAGRFAGPPFEGVVEATNVRVALERDLFQIEVALL